MLEKLNTLFDTIYRWLATRAFFAFSLVYFAAHSLWVILSSNLLPYDEYYHVAIIKQYALQWSPFITSQPTEGIFYGDITRLHSYLYHYLMSFPYRLFDTFIDSETILIILLRIVNLLLVIGGIILFRKLFLKAGISARLANIAVAIFVSTPFVVILASQNNYDNLMFLLSPLFFWCAYSIVRKKRTSLVDIVGFLLLGMAISLVKHSFTLFVAMTTLYIGIALLRTGRVKEVYRDIVKGCRHISRYKLVLLVLALFLTTGLFIERHGLNIYRYGTVNVNCSKVQSVEVCDMYSPWSRNERIKKNPPQQVLYGNPVSFTQHWVATMMSGLYAIFANIIPENINKPDPYGHYVFKPLLWFPVKMAYAALILAILSIAKYWRVLYSNKTLRMFAFLSIGVLVVLFLFNYRTYLNLGRAYAIQVRYMLPLLLPIMLIISYSVGLLLKNIRYKKQLVILALALHMLNGGVVGWIIRSDPSWYWQNQTVISVNQKAQAILEKIAPN